MADNVFRDNFTKPREGGKILELFWKAKGGSQGDLQNSCDSKGYEKFSRIIGISWGIKSPRDIATGQASGKRVHGDLIITKQIDKSSPLLLQAMFTNEVIKESEFAYVDILGHGQMQAKTGRVLTIKTTNGFISEIEGGSTPEGVMIEQIHLIYHHIMFRHEPGSTEATDDRTGTAT